MTSLPFYHHSFACSWGWAQSALLCPMQPLAWAWACNCGWTRSRAGGMSCGWKPVRMQAGDGANGEQRTHSCQAPAAGSLHSAAGNLVAARLSCTAAHVPRGCASERLPRAVRWRLRMGWHSRPALECPALSSCLQADLASACEPMRSGHMHDVGVVCKKEQPGEGRSAVRCVHEGRGALSGIPSQLVPMNLTRACAAVTARVVNATSVAGRVSGRLELLHKGSWKSACSSGFNNAAATVVCKQVGGSWGVLGCALPAERSAPSCEWVHPVWERNVPVRQSWHPLPALCS